MLRRSDLLRELVESEYWAALKDAAQDHIKTYQNAALAPAECEWDFVVRERNAHTARAIPAFLLHIEAAAKNLTKRERGVQDDVPEY